MLQYLLFNIKQLFSRLGSTKKARLIESLKASYGKVKEEPFDFIRIEKYFRQKPNSGAYQIVSDKTCNDLDFEELFMLLDRTTSKVGQQYLYNKLRTIHAPDPKKTSLNEHIIDIFSNDSDFRISTQKRLADLSNDKSYYIRTLFQGDQLPKPKWFFIVKWLSLGSLLSIILSFLNSFFLIPAVLIFVVNLILHYWNKDNVTPFISSIPQVVKMNYVADQLFNISHFKALNPSLAKSIKVINEVKSRMSFFRLEANLQGEIEALAWFFFEIIKITFLLEPLLLFGVLDRLNTKRKEIEEVFEFVGHIDMLVSIASLRSSLETYCKPELTTKSNIITTNIYHPLIPNCTVNSIDVKENSILLTGSNMSGKTTFIRTIGINVITSLTINTSFSSYIKLPLLKITSAIRISDDLMNDKSYYFEEVLTIKEMISEGMKSEANLFLLDEIFKGTNTIERIAAGKSVLSALAQNNNIVLVSTHDVELTDMLSNEYDLYHFSETVNDKTIGFDYKIKEGKLKNRNAIRILEVNNYPKEVVQEAEDIAKKLDKAKLS